MAGKRDDFGRIAVEPVARELDSARMLYLARSLTGTGRACYYFEYMTGRAIAAIFVLIVLVITVVAVEGQGGWPRTEYVRTSPAYAPQYTIAEHPVGYPVGYPVGASVVVDSESLTTRLANPTITGTASNISEFGIIISKGKIIPPAQYDGPGSVPHQVWGGTCNTRNGHWYITVDYRNHAPVLQAGEYTVAVYGYSYLLTYRYLTVL